MSQFYTGEVPETGKASSRFSTEFLPAQDRIAIFREVFARNVLGMDVEPLGDSPFRTDMVVRQLPGLNIVWANNSPLRANRTRSLLADGKDGFAFQWSVSPGYGQHLGHQIGLSPNDGVLISCSDPGAVALPGSGSMVSLIFPRAALEQSVRAPSDFAGRPVPAATPALALLAAYANILKCDALTATPELQALAVAHVYDLLALTLGPTCEAVEIARARGLRAARLAAMKKDVIGRLDTDVSIEAVAARHQLSSRQAQRLFAEEGTTFTEFVRDARLHRARAMLMSPRFRQKRIGEIAFDVGFRDLSHFNRWFRARYSASPSDIRNRTSAEN